MRGKKIKLPEINPETAVAEIGNFIVENVLRFKTTGGVVGLSGGVDSTTVAAVAKKAFDRYNASHDSRLEVVGYMLPSDVNKPEDAEDGIDVAKKLGIRYEVCGIDQIVRAFESTNPEAVSNSYHNGNLMSRIRANILHTKAATEKKLVLGTGNRDEDFGVGYYTLFGDGAVHISPIGNLSKRLVKQTASYLGFEYNAKRIPSAGLESNQTDFSDLGYDYDTVEIVVEGIAQGFAKDELANSIHVKNLAERDLKRSNKHGSVSEIVNDIMQRHYEVALPKGELVCPKRAPVTVVYE